MKKLLAVLLAAVMLFSLTGCSAILNRIITATKAPVSNVVTVVGTWKGTVPMDDILGEMAEYVPVEDLSLDIVFTFEEDGTFLATIDEDSARQMVDAMVDAIIALMEESLAFEGMTLEEALSKEGMTLEGLRQMYAEEMNVGSVMDEAKAEGFYKYEEGKIHITMEQEDLDLGDYDSTFLITLTADTLTIEDVAVDGELASVEEVGLFPIVMHRQ